MEGSESQSGWGPVLGSGSGPGSVGGARVRLFVALELPEPVRAELTAWAGRCLGEVHGLRLVDADSLHVTLCFLGSRPADEVAGIVAACRSRVLAGSEVPLSLGEAVWLPVRRPHVVAVELRDEDGRLAQLQSTVAGALAAGGFYSLEPRPFLGHVTVGRVGRGGGRVRPGPLPAPGPLRFGAQAVTLFRSRLGSGPARYEALETIPLG